MTADPIGGVWQYSLELCEALQSYGARVMLATLGAPLSQTQRDDIVRLRHVELRESHCKLEWMEDPWDSLDDASRWLLSLEREFSPNLIHLNHLVHGDLPWHAPVLVVGHSCVFSWWSAVHGSVPPSEWSRYKMAVTRSLKAAQLVCAPTRSMMRALHQHYGPLPRSRVIANGRNPNRFQTITKEPFILSAGRAWDEGKNVDALLSVADKLKWPVFVAGATEAPHGMRRTLKGVRPLGPLPNASLATWYSVAAIYALPARYEPFGLTALEAAFSGCALVLGDIDSLREVWGDAALYVKPDDHASLQDTLNALSADPERLSHYAALAQRRAQNYTTQRCATRYWSAYESLLTMEDDLTCASYSSITH